MVHSFNGKQSKIETETWVLNLSRKLSNEEWDKFAVTINSPSGSLVWDERGREFSLPLCLFHIQRICVDVIATSWHHEPISVFIRSIGLPDKVYLIENAMSLKDATKKASETWREQYGYMGMRSTIITTRLATKKDLKGMMST